MTKKKRKAVEPKKIFEKKNGRNDLYIQWQKENQNFTEIGRRI